MMMTEQTENLSFNEIFLRTLKFELIDIDIYNWKKTKKSSKSAQTNVYVSTVCSVHEQKIYEILQYIQLCINQYYR